MTKRRKGVSQPCPFCGGDEVSKRCSECGHVFGSVEIRPLLPGLGEMIEIGSVDIPNYCPNCGAKVVQ